MNRRGIEKQLKQALWRCAAFLLRAKPSARDSARPDPASFRSILVIRPDRLGDIVLSTPVYESIKQSLPQARLTVVAGASGADVLRDHPCVDELLVYDKKRPWALACALRRGGYDLAVTLNRTFTATAAVIALLSGARWRLNYRNPESEWVYNLLAPGREEIQHEVQNNLDLLRFLGFSRIREQPSIHFNAGEEARVAGLLGELRKFPHRPLVLVKPGTRVPAWGWRLDKFRQVCEHLVESGAAETFVIVGPEEEARMGDLFAGCRDGIALLPRLATKELACLIRHSALLFCNHTGIMHLASATGTPLAVIFKHGQIPRWGPFGIPSVILEERGGDTLAVEDAAKAIRGLLDTVPKKTGL